MTTWNISSRETGLDFGNYAGETVADALEAYARDAQYRSFADLCEALSISGVDATDDLRIVEVV